MSSNASTVEKGVAESSSDAGEQVGTDRTRTRHEVERQLLCDRIEQLERELARERQRRDQVVEQYERLLAEERSRAAESDGLLGGLF